MTKIGETGLNREDEEKIDNLSKHLKEAFDDWDRTDLTIPQELEKVKKLEEEMSEERDFGRFAC